MPTLHPGARKLRKATFLSLREGRSACDPVPSLAGFQVIVYGRIGVIPRGCQRQVREAVSGLDSVLCQDQQGEKAVVSHPFVTGTPGLSSSKPATQ